MGLNVEARLFYGYVQPEADRKDDSENDENPWCEAHARRLYGCIGGIYGYDGHLGYFLAVETSLHIAEWDAVYHLAVQDFEIQPEWDGQLWRAAQEFDLDVMGLQPGWRLVCLYF